MWPGREGPLHHHSSSACLAAIRGSKHKRELLESPPNVPGSLIVYPVGRASFVAATHLADSGAGTGAGPTTAIPTVSTLCCLVQGAHKQQAPRYVEYTWLERCLAERRLVSEAGFPPPSHQPQPSSKGGSSHSVGEASKASSHISYRQPPLHNRSS